MGKLGKTVVDQIHALLEQGFNKTEVASKLGISRKTVASYAVDTEQPPGLVGHGDMGLPPDNEITKLLYEMQGIMGTQTLLEAAQQALRDSISTARLRVTHWPKYSGDEGFSVEGLIRKLLEHIEDLTYDQSIHDEGYVADQVTIVNLKEEVQSKSDASYAEGYSKASQDYAIYVGCVYCGRPCLVRPRSQAHRFISEMLSGSDWGHVGCANRAQYEAERGSQELQAEMMR